jgi:5-carboxymethyl-2-hydroxymuconate isomerase
MTTNKRDSQVVLRVIDQLGAEAEHTDDEARDALEQAGIDPDAFARAVHSQVRTVVDFDLRPKFEVRSSKFELRLRTVALGLAAASVAFFAVSFHLNYGADVQARREAAHAQLIGPLLPALASDDAEQRSLALVVARQVDPTFAADTAVQLARWEVSSQAQARATRNTVFAARILAGLRKLELSRDSDDRKVAIWNDLLPVLLEARKNREDFVDVAIAYQRVLPLLRVRNPEVFLDSYWGELWILNILLDSKIVPVVEAARQQAPEPAVVDQIFQRNATALPDRERRAFEEAIAVYKTTLKALN